MKGGEIGFRPARPDSCGSPIPSPYIAFSSLQQEALVGPAVPHFQFNCFYVGDQGPAWRVATNDHARELDLHLPHNSARPHRYELVREYASHPHIRPFVAGVQPHGSASPPREPPACPAPKRRKCAEPPEHWERKYQDTLVALEASEKAKADLQSECEV